jgi:hypothetical protein
VELILVTDLSVLSGIIKRIDTFVRCNVWLGDWLDNTRCDKKN